MSTPRHPERIARRHGSVTRGLAVAGAALVAIASLPGIALARTTPARIDPVAALSSHRVAAAPVSSPGLRSADGRRAETAALEAYRSYLDALEASESTSAARASALVRSVDASCSDALGDVANLSASQLRRSAMSDFGDELGGDLDLAYMAPSRPALNRFATALGGVDWPTAQQRSTATGLIAAEQAMLDVAPPRLCADADTLDAAPLSEPTGTVRFLRRYRSATNGLHEALGDFQSLLSNPQTATQRRLIGQIDTAVAQFSSRSGAVQHSAVSTVLSDLGLGQLS